MDYVKPKINYNRHRREVVSYSGMYAAKKWACLESYGPKFVENIVQAVSRDILAFAMRSLSGCLICGHIHDELIIEAGPDLTLDSVCERMSQTPPWLPGLLLRADGFVTEWYCKEG